MSVRHSARRWRCELRARWRIRQARYRADADLDGLHFAAVIGGRRLYYAAFPSQARFRITMVQAWERRTGPLGSVIRLDTDSPGLRVCAPLEVEWAEAHAEEIVAEAVSVWRSSSRGGGAGE